MHVHENGSLSGRLPLQQDAAGDPCGSAAPSTAAEETEVRVHLFLRIRFRAGAADSGAVQLQTPRSQQTAQPARLHQRRLARIRTRVREPIPARLQDGKPRRRSRGRRPRQVKTAAPPHPRTRYHGANYSRSTIPCLRCRFFLYCMIKL
jgi:hypothetical protein